jgi:O-antigen/teichoic acid export membrane protein
MIARLGPRARSPAAKAALSGVWVQLMLIITGILAARVLGVEDRGHFALIWLIPVAIGAIGNLGLPLASIYWVAPEHGLTRSIIRLLIPVAVLQGVAMVCIHAGILAIYLPGKSDAVVSSAIVSLPMSAGILAQLYGLALLQARSRFNAFAIARALPTTCYALAATAIAIAGADLLSFTIALVAATVVGAILTIAIGLTRLPAVQEDKPVPSVRAMLGFGLRALLGSFSAVETLQVDQIFVGVVLSPRALGLYAVATAFTNMPRFIVTSIGMVGYPQVASIVDPEDSRRRIWRIFWLTVGSCAALVGVLEAIIGWLLPFLFGDSFAEAIPLARILLFGVIFLAARRILSDSIRGAGFPGLGTVAEIASWAWLVPALIVMSHLSGVEGSAWATASAYAFSLAVLALLVSRHAELRPGRRLGLRYAL